MGRFQVTDQSYDPVLRLLRSEFDDFIVLLPVVMMMGERREEAGTMCFLTPPPKPRNILRP